MQNQLVDHGDRKGSGGQPIKSNITDNELAKMKTSKGVIHGYRRQLGRLEESGHRHCRAFGQGWNTIYWSRQLRTSA